jgi:hypothetical protein
MQVQSLGRYRVEKELGRGAMGRVFLAHDPEIDRLVAIKTIQIFASLPNAERAQARDRFLREARSAGKLLHPGIVTIFDVGEAEGVPYLAMEFVEGETLDAACRPDALLPVATVVALVAAAADALAFAHERGVIHRDIKPANLMRVGDRGVKIMDFGLAKNSASSVTHDGALFGTPNYMSPEQVRGDPLDGRTDLFSLGVVCYELLTGSKPFGGDSVSSVLYRVVHEPPQDLSVRLDRVPHRLAEFLERALTKEPGGRFPNAAAFAAALRSADVEVETVTATPRTPRQPSSPSPPPVARLRPGRVIAWTALGLATMAAGASYAVRVGPFAPPEAVVLTTHVRTEPAGIPIRLNGAPYAGGSIRFSANGPFEVLAASEGCREVKHRIDPADAGGEIVMVLDPARTVVSVDPGVSNSRVALNGVDAGITPTSVEIDLCRENTIEIQAAGYRAARTVIPAKASPLEARSAVARLKLETIPTGRVLFAATRVPTQLFVDGQPVTRPEGGLELAAGPHEVRATNEERFIDVAVNLEIPAGGVATATIPIPALARLIVQTFPPNCSVHISRSGSPWRSLGETPLRYELAAGRYRVRIESSASADRREVDVDLVPGSNPPVRVSFGRSGP